MELNTILKNIVLNEISYNVTLLHKALEALGLPVAGAEVDEGKAGEDTLKRVRTLQMKLNVPFDESTLMNEATALAITDSLKKLGLTAASSSFTVTGAVKLRNGEVKKRQQLIAFDLDLRGVAVYRTVKTVEEIKKSGGFEFLGQSVSDNKGNYSFTFYDWQYRQVERKKADVVVYAIQKEEIIGSSRIVNSEDYSDKGLVRDLDVIITQEDKRTEYEALMSELNAFLKESKTQLSEIAKSSDQLVFTAGELDVDQSRINIAASAELLAKRDEKKLLHELLYGIGRQDISLTWAVLYKKKEEELRRSIAKSEDEGIIRKFKEVEINAFLKAIQEHAVRYMLDDKNQDNKNSLNAMLKNALPTEEQRLSLLYALRSFKGSDFQEFWNKHLPSQPEFKDKPELIAGLLLTQQITMITGNHQALVTELQVNRKLTSAHQLLDLEKKEWIDIIQTTGVPDFIEGKDDKEKTDKYADMMQGLLNKAFPTQRIARMVEKKELPIEKNNISKGISAFISKNVQFDFAGSRIHDFDKEIEAAAGGDFKEVRSELMKIQRVFQVSTKPEDIPVLMEKNLHSAYSITSFPQKSFAKTYGKDLGGEDVAMAIHKQASFISGRTEMTATSLLEYSRGETPESVMGTGEHSYVMEIINNKLPNYSELFGSPDICQCEHCRSVYSPAAYFVDMLRFLKHGVSNSDTLPQTPLDILATRRPDLLHLPLTCENTNTIIPYIDLANEVMEYYTAHESIAGFEGYNTGEATAEELRANPQNFNLAAYRILSNNNVDRKAVYPFTLPYHQPLDVIRTYSDHLKVSRYEVMKAMNPQPNPATTKTIEAESLGISWEEYTILTTPDPTPLYEYYGYPDAIAFANMQNETDSDGKPRGIRPLLLRTGLAYTDLVELIKTRFINPHKDKLDCLQKIFSYISPVANAADINRKLGAIRPSDVTLDTVIAQALEAYNGANPETIINLEDFVQWVTNDENNNLNKFRQVITLYEPESKCDLNTTQLRTIQSIYEGGETSGILNDTWSKIHRFIRLWSKLGWTIHETDLMLTALGDDDITTETIGKLETVSLLSTATKIPLNQLAVFWGEIDTYGEKSLYKKLFLNKAVQRIDEAFKADAWGNYLQDETEIIAHSNPTVPETIDHRPAILAALRITGEDLNAIVEVAEVISEGRHRKLNIFSDILNIQNLSTIYRYVVLAKALKMRVTDLCKLIGLFNASPFSIWDIEPKEFTNISPADTYEFYKLALSTKEAGFKPSVLEYILKATLPADSNIGLNNDKILQTAKTIRYSFAAIEQDHPETPESPVTVETIVAKLSLTFKPEIISRFMGIIIGSASFETVTEYNLDVVIPDNLADKYTYIKGSGRLTCTGITSDTEQSTLKELANASANFQAAVDELYAAPETFITDNFNAIFSNLAQAKTMLLDHPAQAIAATLDKKLAYVYENFLPMLKSKLRQDAITQHIAALIGLSEESTSLLIAVDIETLITDLSTDGFSAIYFNDATWNTAVLERTDRMVDFSWANNAPDPLVPADNFSVRWNAYIAAPASGEYTLVVEVEEADETFNLYLDGTLILEKSTADTATSWEVVTTLNAAHMHLLTLEYTEGIQNAGIRLRWKTATTALEIVPASVAYPTAILDNFVVQATVFHQAAKFISGFEISDTELKHFIAYNAYFGNINFKSLTTDHWKRVYAYTSLRNVVPQSQALLIDVFLLANTSDPALSELTRMLHLATAWDDTNLNFLVGHFELTAVDFKNEIAINRLHNVMKIVSKIGISAETIAKWGAAETVFDDLNETAQLIKNTVKSKYEDNDWLDIAGNLSNKIRENQKQALVSYLLMQQDIQDWGAEDADGLFEYLLIDVQMGACMDTSRIVQANASVQMFVNRCLLNLESKIEISSDGVEKELGVSPGAIDRDDRWEWMKNYRVWEAPRKVFLNPENLLEPEWRKNRSEFFKELESYLVQNDITERSVEQGLRNYLTSLNEVANLEVCGMYQENQEKDDSKIKKLHVFGRTHNAPYKFFYRTWNEHMKWSAWEKVPVDIRVVENGDNSGVHLLPVVWKNRLFLFWPEFMEIQESPSGTNRSTFEGLGSGPVSSLEPIKHWDIRLAWSEYVDSKWNPKQVSPEFIEFRIDDVITNESKIRLVAGISENKLYISTNYQYLRDYYYKFWAEYDFFTISDISSKIEVSHSHFSRVVNQWDGYRLSFMNYAKMSTLQLLHDVYLKKETDHKLLLTPSRKNYIPTLEDPFFFSDAYRTYFVRPVDLSIILRVRNPAIGVGFIYGNDIGVETIYDKGLEFHTFYHPYSTKYVTRLNQGGIPALMGSDTEPLDDDAIISDEGSTFYKKYGPNDDSGFVQPSLDDLQANENYKGRTYYKENVCFDVYGANSLYNWELFFHAPLYIATRLSKNGKYEEAMKWFHYIFDPTTNEGPVAGKEISRYWKVLPFKTTPSESLEDWFMKLNRESDPSSPSYKSDSELSKNVSEWRDNPFDPHIVASNRPLAYMKHVVIKYVENLIAWGDSLFRQDTMESVNEAIQIYVIANHILGPRPEFIPKRGKIKAESYDSIKNKWDDFSNALVELENIFPYSSDISVSSTSTRTNLLGIGSALYFCIPANEKLLGYWDTVADRLFKIRHCQNIDGVERSLALFSPQISPEALIQAASQGISLGSILADLSSQAPIYRFSYLIQKANEFCSDVKNLGSALLAAIEKKDGEELSRLRASHETNMLGEITAIKERQLLDAKVNKENLLKGRETAAFRLQHYIDLLGNENVTVPAEPKLEADNQLPVDTSIPKIETDVDESLVESDERGVKLIPKEKEALEQSKIASDWQDVANWTEMLASSSYFLPEFGTVSTPWGVGVDITFGGSNVGSAISAVAKGANAIAAGNLYDAQKAGNLASYIRREQDWTLQANLAAREIIQLDKQITSADIRIQIADKELENHKQQIDNSKEVELFLKDKFTNQELYQWMKEQLFAVYKQSYNLAYDMAKKAEKAYKFERGTETVSFIQYGYWDNSKQGLVAGEKLQMALRQLEKSYLEENRRELELTKSISLAMLNPLALIELRETGKCYVSLPEELFDLDFQGHYFRRIKSMSLSIPCIAGPFTTINCSLRLVNNTIRINTSMSDDYEHNNDEGLWIDDERFRTSNVPVTSIATSSGQNDAGMFEFNFRDERYLPFEGAGAISDWQIELSTEKDLRQFDYSTISDVILHLKFTARENGGLKTGAVDHIIKFIKNTSDLVDQPLMRMLSMKQEFPTEWHKFLHPGVEGGEQVLNITIGKDRMPFFTRDRKIDVMSIDVLLGTSISGVYHLLLSVTDAAENITESRPITMTQKPEFGNLQIATIDATNIDIEAININNPISLKLNTNPDETKDILLVLHYKLSDESG